MRGFARISAAVPACRVVDFDANRQATLELWQKAHEEGSALVIFPELGLSSYSARDLFLDGHLLDSSLEALKWLAEQGKDLAPMALVGLPLRVNSGLYNVAVALQGGKALAVVPKFYLPNYREFEETRWFRPGAEVPAGSTVHLLGQDVPFGTDILLRSLEQDELCVGIEICEDYWVHAPPSIYQVSAGATVLCNLSASNFVIGKAELRRLLAQSHADRCKSVYVYVAAGPGESSTDLAFDADAFIVENGRILSESKRFAREGQLITADVDLDMLIRERMSTNSFGDCSRQNLREFRTIPFHSPGEVSKPLRREITPHPFLPKDPATLAIRCWEIFEIQVNALVTRMKAAHIQDLVLGVSGGLDSTQAALVCAAALDLLDLPRSKLHCITMPGLGTSQKTHGNAVTLSKALGGSFQEISISEASRLILKDTGHGAAVGTDTVAAMLEKLRSAPELGDVVLENVQARMRTLLLMTLANEHSGLVVGTGDLSEKALGWATYSGDHIAMYDVNAGVPKTLIQFVIRWVANERASTWTAGDTSQLKETLFSILNTPISPELLPADADGHIAQLTEDTLGPYEVHDFYLYHFVRHGARPTRLLDLAQIAFTNKYGLPELREWLTGFLKRFFRNQFKRSCTADAPKVGMVALSPRGDWRMPSDAVVKSWLEEVAAYPEDC
jgi:NAD+ synthase (glutamine-hydrolysing)